MIPVERRRAQDLSQRLAEAEATLKALLSGEIDAVVDARTSTPVLLAKAQTALRESEDRYRVLFESSPTPKWLYDAETLRFVVVNDAAVRSYGYSREEFLKMSIRDIRPPEDLERLDRELAQGDPATAAFGAWRHRKKDGTVFEVEVTAASFPLEDREMMLAVVQDVTERRRTEQTQRWLAAIVEASWDAIVGTDTAGRITSWNAAAERLYGYAAGEVLGKPISIIRMPGHGGKAADNRARVLAGELLLREFEEVRLRKDGTRVEVSVSLSLIRESGGKVHGICGVSRDITHRRAAEAQVRLLHNIAVAAAEVITLEETLGAILRLICEATGAPVANAWVIGQSGQLEHRGQWARPEDRARFRRLAEGWSFEKGAGLPGRVWASKEPVWIEELHLDPNCERAPVAADLGIRAGLAVPVLAGDELVAVIEAFLPTGERLAELVGLLSAVGAQLGSVLQRRRAEEALHKSEEQFRQAQKMEAIGQLTGGVAHDFNNLLSVILSYSGLLADDMDPSDPRREDLLQIKVAGERAAALTRQLLAFSRQQVLQPRVLDLNLVVGGMEKMLRRLIGEDLEFRVVPLAQPAMVHIDPGQMEQVLMNLVVNARDAMPTGGKLTIEVARAVLDQAFVQGHAGSATGPHVVLAVRDTGSGMDAATQARAFEPFFTTKERGKGTGLGLSTVFGIVRQSAGTIWIDSKPGAGTAFRIYLPCAGPGVERPVSPQGRPALLEGTETVLLVEDEESVRRLVHSVLQRNGYRVLAAKDGAEALRIAGAEQQIDLLLTDVVMPGMGGAEVASRLLALRPGLKLLYMSGYTDDAVVLHGVQRLEMAFVQKPITPWALLARVREVLDSAARG